MRTQWVAIAYALFIILIIAMANFGYSGFFSQLVRQIPYGDKFGHLFLIGLLAFVINLSLQGKKIQVFHHTVLQGSVIVAILVMLEELSQFFMINRTFDIGDLLFDFIGIFIFGRVATFVLRANS